MQPAGGGGAGRSQPATDRSQYPAGRSQEIEPECSRQAVSAERGRRPGQVSTTATHTLAPRAPPQLHHIRVSPAHVRHCCALRLPPPSCFNLFHQSLLSPSWPFVSTHPFVLFLSSPFFLSTVSHSPPFPSSLSSSPFPPLFPASFPSSLPLPLVPPLPIIGGPEAPSPLPYCCQTGRG